MVKMRKNAKTRKFSRSSHVIEGSTAALVKRAVARELLQGHGILEGKCASGRKKHAQNRMREVLK